MSLHSVPVNNMIDMIIDKDRAIDRHVDDVHCSFVERKLNIGFHVMIVQGAHVKTYAWDCMVVVSSVVRLNIPQ